ncbi:MAG TPA: hypothetical protein VFU94_10970 [Conexibacter sp.]|nr:hypothetical protein [Conexibacter sp.]
MPWFKCSHCRIRRSGLDVAISAAQDSCPLCGRELESERDLTSLVGFSFLRAVETPLSRGGTGRTIDADTATDVVAARWTDEGGDNGPAR